MNSFGDHRLQNLLNDLFFPKKCVNCSSEGHWLCPNCRDLLKVNREFSCPVCRQIQPDNRVCENCRAQSALDGLWVLADYNDELVKKIICLIKYNFVCELAGSFDGLIKNYFNNLPQQLETKKLLAVPLAKKRFLSRGFNQADLICQAVERVFGNEILEPLLERTSYKEPQVKLPREERKKNVIGNFELTSLANKIKREESLVLVDDVYTTGSTMQECAKVLKAAGFLQVWGLVIARG